MRLCVQQGRPCRGFVSMPFDLQGEKHGYINRLHLKNVFGPPAFGGIGASFKILNIHPYASGFKLGAAAILNQNPIFEMGSWNTVMILPHVCRYLLRSQEEAP